MEYGRACVLFPLYIVNVFRIDREKERQGIRRSVPLNQEIIRSLIISNQIKPNKNSNNISGFIENQYFLYCRSDNGLLCLNSEKDSPNVNGLFPNAMLIISKQSQMLVKRSEPVHYIYSYGITEKAKKLLIATEYEINSNNGSVKQWDNFVRIKIKNILEWHGIIEAIDWYWIYKDQVEKGYINVSNQSLSFGIRDILFNRF